MAIDTERITGYQIGGVKLGRDVTEWTEINLDVNEEASNAKASSSNQLADVSTGTGISGSLVGFLGSENNGETLWEVNDPIDFEDIVIGVDGDPILAILSNYSDFAIVGPLQLRLVDGPATFTVNFRSGRKNRNTA